MSLLHLDFNSKIEKFQSYFLFMETSIDEDIQVNHSCISDFRLKCEMILCTILDHKTTWRQTAELGDVKQSK